VLLNQITAQTANQSQLKPICSTQRWGHELNQLEQPFEEGGEGRVNHPGGVGLPFGTSGLPPVGELEVGGFR
jgi:hypothetical protein